MKILIVEDYDEKMQRVTELLQQNFDGAEVLFAKSYNSGLSSLIEHVESLDLLILDMSMPTFDVSDREPTGGVPESFAGRDLLAQMKLRDLNVPTIVFTQFDSFGTGRSKISLYELERELKIAYSPIFCGSVYYSSAQHTWKSELLSLITYVQRARR